MAPATRAQTNGGDENENASPSLKRTASGSPKKEDGKKEDAKNEDRKGSPDGSAASHGTQAENLNDEWKKRPPYKIQDKGDDFKVRYKGSCHCGKVQYQLSREKPLDAKYCHCLTCQKLHGAPFQWAAIFHKDDINFTHGHHDLVWYDPGEKDVRHKLPCKISCSFCRTPIMDEGRNMILLYPTLIDWESDEDKKKFEPTCHMFYQRRVIDIKDGKPKWSGLNKDSERMEE